MITNKLQSARYSRFNETISSPNKDSLWVFDSNNKFKQPWVWASTQANLSSTKILSHVEAAGSRYAPWNPNNATDANDAFLTTHMGAARAAYWYGRARPNANFNYASPMVHSMTYGPYQLPPDSAFHVVIAEVAGFGPGRKVDGTIGIAAVDSKPLLLLTSCIQYPSWDSVLVYSANNPGSISSTGGAGIKYIPTYGIPAYIRDTTVVSMRDVADRCIQMYTGNSKVIKWDTSQYEPSGGWTPAGFSPAPSPSAVAARPKGWNAAIKLPLPAPILTGIVTNTIISEITMQKHY